MINGHHAPDAVDFKVLGGEGLTRSGRTRAIIFESNTGAVDKLFYILYHRQQVRGITCPLQHAVLHAADGTIQTRLETKLADLVQQTW